ncbi:putative NADH dehydrogenase, 64 kd subunit, mitochondrial [Clavulina sp. PMI_390]|nr:putative NADH dehydrogenase, 64 kd subunit, mitochondrial [Clavulina sp. PMI_390]
MFAASDADKGVTVMMNVSRTLLRVAPRPQRLLASSPATPRLASWRPSCANLGLNPSRSFSSSRAFFTENATRPTLKERLTAKKAAILCAKYTAFLVGSSVLGVFTFMSVVFVHDAFTYTSKHVDRVPVNPLALHPELGGPKNLPVARVLIDDEEDEASQAIATKPKLVIVGGGWGAMGVLKSLAPGDYHVTVISPDTFNHFTPLLPSAAVGTVGVRSLVESLRRVIARVHGHFIEGKAVDLVMAEKLLEVEIDMMGEKRNVYIPYDKLIIAPGSVSAEHGVPGLENCFQLKTIEDAKNIRRRVIDNLEAASSPVCSDEERKRLLSFVICGGGPTGVETAAEISDLCQEDIINYCYPLQYPKFVRELVSIHIIQSQDHILNTYSENISKYAESKFKRDEVNVITGSRVKEVTPEYVVYTTKDKETGKTTEHRIPANFVLWSTGIAMNPFTRRVSDLLPNQVHKKAIEVDAFLRVKGAPLGTVYALGDAATIETSVNDYLLDLVDEADLNKDGRIDFGEWEIMVKAINKKVPMASTHLSNIREIFEEYDVNHDGKLTLNELNDLLTNVARKITALPATAQVASQQGKYLGAKFTKLAKQHSTLAANGLFDDEDSTYDKPFSYRHLGSLAYIGSAAAFDYYGYSFAGGLAAMYAWRSIYWSEQVSMRTRALLMFDWIVRGIWGRDISRL